MLFGLLENALCVRVTTVSVLNHHRGVIEHGPVESVWRNCLAGK